MTAKTIKTCDEILSILKPHDITELTDYPVLLGDYYILNGQCRDAQGKKYTYRISNIDGHLIHLQEHRR